MLIKQKNEDYGLKKNLKNLSAKIESINYFAQH